MSDMYLETIEKNGKPVTVLIIESKRDAAEFVLKFMTGDAADTLNELE